MGQTKYQIKDETREKLKKIDLDEQEITDLLAALNELLEEDLGIAERQEEITVKIGDLVRIPVEKPKRKAA